MTLSTIQIGKNLRRDVARLFDSPEEMSRVLQPILEEKVEPVLQKYGHNVLKATIPDEEQTGQLLLTPIVTGAIKAMVEKYGVSHHRIIELAFHDLKKVQERDGVSVKVFLEPTLRKDIETLETREGRSSTTSQVRHMLKTVVDEPLKYVEGNLSVYRVGTNHVNVWMPRIYVLRMRDICARFGRSQKEQIIQCLESYIKAHISGTPHTLLEDMD